MNLQNISLTLANNDNISELTVSGEIMYQEFKLDSIFIKGVFQEKNLLIRNEFDYPSLLLEL